MHFLAQTQEFSNLHGMKRILVRNVGRRVMGKTHSTYGIYF